MKYVDYLTHDLDLLIERYNKAKEKDKQKDEDRKNILLQKYAPTIKKNIAGIYGIKIENKIVYVGKSKWIAQRVIEHIGSIENVISNMILNNDFEKKYTILAEAVLRRYKIEFITLYECDSFVNNKYSLSQNELKDKLTTEEIYYIKFYNPPLNLQYTDRIYLSDKIEEILNEAKVM